MNKVYDLTPSKYLMASISGTWKMKNSATFNKLMDYYSQYERSHIHISLKIKLVTEIKEIFQEDNLIIEKVLPRKKVFVATVGKVSHS